MTQKKHIVLKVDRERSAETGEKIRALCGLRWAPTPSTPEELAAKELCLRCEKARERIPTAPTHWKYTITVVDAQVLPD